MLCAITCHAAMAAKYLPALPSSCTRRSHNRCHQMNNETVPTTGLSYGQLATPEPSIISSRRVRCVSKHTFVSKHLHSSPCFAS